MPVTGGETGELFRVTIVKYLATNPDRKWANNYEVRSKETFTAGQLNQLGLVLVDFEKEMHLLTVQFDRLRISTWEEDSVPYDPTTFSSLPLTGTGVVEIGGDQASPLNQCLDVGRIPASGRFGHIYYRGALKEGNISAPAGKAVLTDPAAIATALANAVGLSELFNYLAGGGGEFELVMIDKTGTQVRPVISLQRRGVATLPLDHAWFNRTPAP